MTDGPLERLADLVRRASGIQLASASRWLLEARAQVRARAVGAPDLGAYVAQAASDESELGALVDAIRVGETRFFRHGAQLQALKRVVLPELRARASAGSRRLRAWSAGCSTGEEPYTLAILLAESMPRARGFDLSVLATDLSDEALATAARGRYAPESLEPVPEALRAKYFVSEGEERVVGPDLRAIVRFERRNLATDPYPRGFDLVLCRNVLIYFGPLGRAAVVRSLSESLVPGGFLFLGYSETLRDFAESFEVLTTEEGTLYRKRESARGDRADASTSTTTATATATATAAATATATATGAPTLELKGSYDESDPRRLVRELTPLLETNVREVFVDLDGASFLSDDVARDLRRANAALLAEGRALVLVAKRAGVVRWLDRMDLREELRVISSFEEPA